MENYTWPISAVDEKKNGWFWNSNTFFYTKQTVGLFKQMLVIS